MGKTGKNLTSFATFGALAKPLRSLKNSLLPDIPDNPAQPMTAQDADVQAAIAAEQERARLSRRKGQNSNILTGPLGDTSSPDLARKVLLGAG